MAAAEVLPGRRGPAFADGPREWLAGHAVRDVLADNLDTCRLIHEPVLAALQEQLAQHAQQYRRTRAEYSDARLDTTRKLSGDEIVERLQWTLDNLGVTRHTYQIQFHELFLRSCLPKIYQGEWEAHHDDILRRYSLERLAQETLVVCPRRFGKTYSVAMFCAAYAWCVPDSEIAIFSTGQRAAGKLMALCLKFLSVLEGFQERLHTKNVEKIVLKFSEQDFRSINCYPGSVKAELLLLDTGERAYGGALPCALPLQPLAGPPRASTAPTLLAVHVPLAAYPAAARAFPGRPPVLRVTAGPQLLAAVRLPPPQRVVGGRTVAWLRIEGAVAAAQRTVPLAATLAVETAGASS